jgi:hypothetical protein
MGIHAINAFAPAVPVEDAELRLEQALAKAGRTVGARHPYPLEGDPRWRPGALHWEVVELRQRGGTVLRTYQHNGPYWDPRFLRALSSVCDGFVQGIEHLRNREHYAQAAMFAGRTIELMEYDAATGARGSGLPPHYDLLHGIFFEDVQQRRFIDLCDFTMRGQPWETRVIAAGEWEVSPPIEGFSLDDETPTTRMVLAWLEEAEFRAAIPALGAEGWRWRAFRSPKVDSACIELAHDGSLDRAVIRRWASELHTPYVAFEIPGGARPMPYVQSFDDGDETAGEAVGFEQLRVQLFQIAGMYSEGVGMLFGSGNTGWQQI